jgi:hypothetical protein
MKERRKMKMSDFRRKENDDRNSNRTQLKCSSVRKE